MTAVAPRFRELSRTESDVMLARNQVGRLAYTMEERVNIVPVNYVYADGWLYGRTGAGTKLEAMTQHPWVAMEIDEVDGPFDWRSVVVSGVCDVLSLTYPSPDWPSYQRGLQLLRTLVPETLHIDDPVPSRYVIFRIHTDEVTGQAATTSPEE